MSLRDSTFNIPSFSVDTQVSSLKRLLEECERKSGDLGLEIANFTERREKVSLF